MEDLLHIDIEDGGDSVRLVLSGELDLSTADQARAALEQARGDRSAVVIDITELSFIDSTGVQVLVEAARQAADAGFALSITKPTGEPRHVLEISGILQLLPISE